MEGMTLITYTRCKRDNLQATPKSCWLDLQKVVLGSILLLSMIIPPIAYGLENETINGSVTTPSVLTVPVSKLQAISFSSILSVPSWLATKNTLPITVLIWVLFILVGVVVVASFGFRGVLYILGAYLLLWLWKLYS